MSGLALFTNVHVMLSLLGIAAGFVVMFGFFASTYSKWWNTFFLVTTVATSVTGFGFPFHGLLPSHIVALISLVVLCIAIFARSRHLAGAWRPTYVITSMMALFFNVFVLIAQSFQKIPTLKAIAPTQSEPPFAITQGLILVLFIALTVAAVRKFHGETLAAS
jgi:hypothetical protein